jgi:hypothetical protein
MPKSLRDKMAELPPERRARVEAKADRLQAQHRSLSGVSASAPAEPGGALSDPDDSPDPA